MGGAQGGKLVGNGGFRHAEQVGEVADAEVGTVECHEQTYTRHVTEHLEKVGNGQEKGVLWGGCAQGSEQGVMVVLFGAERYFRFHGASKRLNF